MPRRTEHHLVRFGDEPVTHQAGGADRVVVRPDTAAVIRKRVVAAHRLGQRAYAPPAQHPGIGKRARDRARLLLVDDSGPQTVPHVGTDAVDLVLVAIEAHREVSGVALIDPEVLV
jgi:hypothetical protein